MRPVRQMRAMNAIFSIVLAVHIVCGLVCTLAGLVPLLTRKGGQAHRRAGRLFVWAMGVLLGAAWLMTALHFSIYFLALSAMATLGLFSGVRVLRRKRPDILSADRATGLDWAVTVGIISVSAWTLFASLGEGTGGSRTVSIALAASGLVYGGYDIWRFCQPTAWPFTPRLWLYEHLVKMIGAYSAVMAAFAGNFIHFIPAPWSQLWPSILFQLLAIAWIIRLVTQDRARQKAR